MISDINDNAEVILRAATQLKYHNLAVSYPYLLAYDRGSVRNLHQQGACVYVKGPTNQYVLPVEDMTPKEFLAEMASAATRFPLTGVSFPYRKAMAQMGFHTAETASHKSHEFIYSTAHLLSTMEKGRRYNELRRQRRIFLRNGGYFAPLDHTHVNQTLAVEKAWVDSVHEDNPNQPVLRKNDASLFLEAWPSHNPAWRCRALGAFNADHQLLAFSIACLVSHDHWTCAYSYGSRDYPSLMNLSWLELAKEYADIPYENDGNGWGARLYQNKMKFMSPDMENRQLYLGKVEKDD